MSARLLGLAFDAEAPSASAKLVLIKLVDCCDDEGRKIFPAKATLARAAQCDVRTVQRHIAMFCAVGLLRLVREGGQGRGSTSHYELDLTVLNKIVKNGWAAVAGTVVSGANDDDEPVSDGASHDETAYQHAGAGAGDADHKGDTMSPYRSLSTTLATDKGDTSVTQPLNRIPQELERERVSADDAGAPRIAKGSLAPNAGLPSEGEATEASEPIPQLAEFVKRWPTSIADSKVKVANAWAELTIAERRDALASIDRFLAALKAMRRSHPPGGFTYLSERRWLELPAMKAEVSGGEIVQVKPFSRPWWAMFHRARASGQGNARLLLQRADQGREMSFRKAEIDEAKPEALKPFPASGDAAKGFVSRARAAGFHFPTFRDDAWIFLPDRSGADQAADDLKQAGGL